MTAEFSHCGGFCDEKLSAESKLKKSEKGKMFFLMVKKQITMHDERWLEGVVAFSRPRILLSSKQRLLLAGMCLVPF